MPRGGRLVWAGWVKSSDRFPTAPMRGRGPAVDDITLTTGRQLPWIGERLSRKNQLARWPMLREPSISLIMLRRRRPADSCL